jgi:hypothetical protein
VNALQSNNVDERKAKGCCLVRLFYDRIRHFVPEEDRQMVKDETRRKDPVAKRPNAVQQLINRLWKKYENLDVEERHVRIIDDINRMDISERTRKALIRRVE